MGMERIEFKVTGMDCPACSGTIRRNVGRVGGVAKVSVDFMMERVSVDYEPANTSVEEIRKAIEKGGFKSSMV